jgi:WD40-like Beta Propeller Repeat
MNARAAVLFLTVVSAQPMAAPAPSAVPFATGADDYGPAFTPDGKTVYFTRRVNRRGEENIVVSDFGNGRWSEPRGAGFSGTAQDKEPYVSPDGKRLFFASMRGSGRRAGFDLWFVERKGRGWSEPRKLDAAVNSDAYDNYPAVSANGTLYFGSERPGGKGEIDLYRSRFIGGRYAAAENLGDAINTPAVEADPYIAPDESFLIFCSTRAGGFGEGDLYISFRDGASWTPPVNLGSTFNGPEFDYTPLVSPDRRRFYWSRGWGGIYEISAAALPRRR